MEEQNKKAPSNPQNSEGAILNDQYKDININPLVDAEFHDIIEQAEVKQIPFPVTSFKEPLLSFITEIAGVYSVPPEFPACAALGAVSASLQKKINLYSGKYLNYPQIWLMLIAPPGVGKSEPLNLAFRKLAELDKNSFDIYNDSMGRWKSDCLLARKEKTVEPEKPNYRQHLINDFTPESLFSTMYHNENSITLFRDELSGWFSDFGRYNKSGEVGHYLSMFNNADLKINRKTQEPLLLHKPFISVVGSIQPEVVSAILKNQSLIENGFASRFLFAYPRNIKKPYYSDMQVNPFVLDKYYKLIEHLYMLPTIEESVKLSVEAKRLYVDFSNSLTDKSNKSTENYIKAIYAKMDIHLLRIALILFIVDSVYEDEVWKGNQILPDIMQRAIEIVNYFTSTSLMLYEQNHISNFNISDAIRLIEKEKGIVNKQAFAESIGVTRQYISKLCNP